MIYGPDINQWGFRRLITPREEAGDEVSEKEKEEGRINGLCVLTIEAPCICAKRAGIIKTGAEICVCVMAGSKG